jgi:putative transposase
VKFIDEHRHDSIDGREFGVEPICRVLLEHGCPIAPSSYYAARARPMCDRMIRDAELLTQIRRVQRGQLRGVWDSQGVASAAA